MTPAGFKEENAVLDPPRGAKLDEEVSCLSVFKGSVEYDDGSGAVPVVISCWKLTPAELKEITRTGRVWLVVMGRTMPPAYLDGLSPFRDWGKDAENNG